MSTPLKRVTSPRTRQKDISKNPTKNHILPFAGGVGEGFKNDSPLSDCKPTKQPPKKQTKHINNYGHNSRPACIFGSWQRYKSKANIWFFRRVEKKVYLPGIRPIENQPFITIYLRDKIYLLEGLHPKLAYLKNLVTGRKSIVSSDRLCYQVQVIDLIEFVKHSPLFSIDKFEIVCE